MNIIETKNLSKSYADFTAVSNLNLHVPKETVYGFVGPNGAGKSTTMKMLLGLTRPSGGTFVIDRKSYPHNRVKILREIGSFIEAPAFYGNLTGEENLDIIRQILGLPKSSVDDALELVGSGTEVAAVMGLTKAAALAYLMFNLYTPPCFAALGAMNSEMKSGKWLLGGICLQLATGYTVAFLVYQIGTLITTGSLGTAFVPGLIAVLVFAAVILWRIRRSDQEFAAEYSLRAQ